MSSNNIIFEDVVEIKYIDRQVKIFDKVQRCEGKTKDGEYDVTMDINSEIYPMKVGACYSLNLATSIDNTSKESNSKELFNYDLFIKSKNTLLDKYEYVMCGKVFQFSNDKDKDRGTLSISISFGGLLFQISGLKRDSTTLKPKFFEKVNLDDTLYLLMKKMPK